MILLLTKPPPPPAPRSKIESMLEQLLEGQQKILKRPIHRWTESSLTTSWHSASMESEYERGIWRSRGSVDRHHPLVSIETIAYLRDIRLWQSKIDQAQDWSPESTLIVSTDTTWVSIDTNTKQSHYWRLTEQNQPRLTEHDRYQTVVSTDTHLMSIDTGRRLHQLAFTFHLMLNKSTRLKFLVQCVNNICKRFRRNAARFYRIRDTKGRHLLSRNRFQSWITDLLREEEL